LEQLKTLSSPEGLKFKATLIASLATVAPLLLDYIIDIYYQDRTFSTQVKIPRLMLIIVGFLPDIFLLFVVLPFEKYDWFPSVVCCRDLLYLYGWLTYMNHLCPEIWSLVWITGISSCFGSANLLTTIISFRSSGNSSDVARDDTKLDTIKSLCLLTSVSLGFTLYLFRFYKWINHYYSINACGRRFLGPCHLYSVLFIIYMMADWSYTGSWAFDFGSAAYMTFYTCVMTLCTLVAVVMAAKIQRLDAAEFKVCVDPFFEKFLN
jgi:hypothetical protein